MKNRLLQVLTLLTLLFLYATLFAGGDLSSAPSPVENARHAESLSVNGSPGKDLRQNEQGCSQSWLEQTIDFLAGTLKKHPRMEAVDLYKTAYQAILGPSHFMRDTSRVMEFLANETANLGRDWGGDTILVERMNRRFIRLNLRPYLERGGDLKLLTLAFQRSGDIMADTGSFSQLWKDLLNRNPSPLPDKAARDKLAPFIKEMEALNWPAVHHSEEYRKLYNPHYRVLSWEEAEKLLRAQFGELPLESEVRR